MSGDFGTSSNTVRKAIKDHVCCECEEPILKGEKYTDCRVVGKYNENNPPFDSQVYKMHESCLDKLRGENDLTDYI
jgi:hypothetical protein